MNNKTLLLTRPSYDLITSYFFYWSKSVIELAESKNVTVIDITHQKVTRRQLSGRLRKTKPEIVLLNGHGSPFEVFGDDGKELLTTKNASDLSGSIVYARSCDSGSMLGAFAVHVGARAFIGYAKPFYMGYDKDKITHPTDDALAKLFLEPSNYVVESLLKGHPAEEASRRSKAMSQKTIQRLMSSDSKPEERVYARFIWSNMQYQVCHGDSTAKL